MLAEGHEQTQGIRLGEIARGLAPMGNKFAGVFGRRGKIRLHLDESVIVETNIGVVEAFLQDGCPGLKSHGGAFDLVGRSQQNFTLAFEERSSHATGDILSEANEAVVERNMEGGAVDRKFARAVNPRAVETHTAEPEEEVFGSAVRRWGSSDFQRW